VGIALILHNALTVSAGLRQLVLVDDGDDIEKRSDGGGSGKAAYSRARDYRPRTQFDT